MNAGFALQYRAPIPPLLWGCQWDWDGAPCREQQPAQDPICLSFLPLFFLEMIHNFKLYNHTTQSQGKRRFQVCYLALYHHFTLEMSFIPLCNSS